MKLSFSTKGWHEGSFEDFCNIAADLRFDGIELHNVYNRLFTDKNGAFHDYTAAATVRHLYEKKLQLPCIDTISNIADKTSEKQFKEEISTCLNIAKNLKIPCIRVKATAALGDSAATEQVYKVLSDVITLAEDAKITILIETSGLFADTKALRDMLERFASD